jgi:8-oxo-dGTP pyrophosphatase MutT (NUDIX family)
MTDAGAPLRTTWDGEPVSPEPPYGATIVVASLAPGGWRFALLHRARHGPDYAGDWAWTPPAGSRKPGEDLAACAARELAEETGLAGEPRPVRTEDADDWALYTLEVPWGTALALDGTEHDKIEWVSRAEALRRIRPAVVADAFIRGCAAAGFS